MAKVKLCGLTRMDDIEAANRYMPDYIGFIFTPKSRRFIEPQKALELRGKLSKNIVSVGVFVDEEIMTILNLIHRGIISMVQLHGRESEDYIQKLKRLTSTPIIKAFSPLRKADVNQWRNCSADYLLFDSINGGSGKNFDWDTVGKPEKPYFLAGGLNAGNIQTALEKTSPFAVDVSSGVETAGYKDTEKIREFIGRVRHEK